MCSDARLEKVQERLDAATQGQVKLTPEMIETYKTVGGTPHLDGQYTVFGEVTEGLPNIIYIGYLVDFNTKFPRIWQSGRIPRQMLSKHWHRGSCAIVFHH